MKRVLIVDDEFGILEALGEVLAEEGFAVSMARNGKDALKRVAEAKPDLIVVDYMMPVMDGATFINEVRKTDQATPIVMMTAVRKEQLPPGLAIAEVLQKPFGIEVLMATVKKLLG